MARRVTPLFFAGEVARNIPGTPAEYPNKELDIDPHPLLAVRGQASQDQKRRERAAAMGCRGEQLRRLYFTSTAASRHVPSGRRQLHRAVSAP